MPTNTRCEFCNKFMSYEDMVSSVRYAPFGGPTDLEPPDEEFMHAACWARMSPEERHLTRSVAWHRPTPDPFLESDGHERLET